MRRYGQRYGEFAGYFGHDSQAGADEAAPGGAVEQFVRLTGRN